MNERLKSEKTLATGECMYGGNEADILNNKKNFALTFCQNKQKVNKNLAQITKKKLQSNKQMMYIWLICIEFPFTLVPI